jgi:hypothetical protein
VGCDAVGVAVGLDVGFDVVGCGVGLDVVCVVVDLGDVGANVRVGVGSE